MGKQDYLFKRTRSPFWQLRLTTPAIGGEKKKTEYVTTGLEVYADAFAWAKPRILDHLQKIADAKAGATHPPARVIKRAATEIKSSADFIDFWSNQLSETGIAPIYALEMEADSCRPTADGGRLECSVDGRQIAIYNSDNKFTGSRPNQRREIGKEYRGDNRLHRDIRERVVEAKLLANNPELGNDLDERMIKAWIDHRHVSDNIQKDMRRAYKTMKQVAPTRNFATLRPQDVAAMVAIWRYTDEATTDTMKKKIGHLRAIVNVCLDRSRRDLFPELRENVFIGDYLPQNANDSERHPPRPFDKRDHALIMADLPSWPRDQQLLYLLGRVYGLRAEECWTIWEEEERAGIRTLVVRGTKNGFGVRNLPVPKLLEPYLPAKIDGCMFKHGEDYTNKQMMIRIRALLEAEGINHDGKTHHCLRHGAETDLGNLLVHQKIVDAVLGHVPDNLKGNEGENQAIRARKSITYRYFHGNAPENVLEALDRHAEVIWAWEKYAKEKA